MNHCCKQNIVKDLKQLQLHIFLIGYPVEGECILIFVVDNSVNEVLFSMMIDCYSYNNYNVAHDILNLYNIGTLDYFIWTHPDNDHSVGIEDTLKKYGLKTTTILLPEGVLNGRKLGENATSALNYINSVGIRKQNYQVNRVSVSLPKNRNIFEETIYTDTIAKLDFSFSIIAPNSAIVGKRTTKNKKCKLNDFSIGIIIHFGDLNFVFGGDIENQTIKRIPEYYFDNIGYIKVPHHGSISSDSLIESVSNISNLSKKQIIAATTVFTNSSLPQQIVLDKYKSFCSNIFYTGSGSQNYGYIKTVYNIAETTVELPEIKGNAICIYR